jgi:hypothetical protein
MSGSPWSEFQPIYEESMKRWKSGKEWRTNEANAGRPSEFSDYCLAHGLCSACHAVGATLNENGIGFKVIGMDGNDQLFERCKVCGGTGKIALKEQ